MKRRDKQRIYEEWAKDWREITVEQFAAKHGTTVAQLDKIIKDGDAAAKRG